MSSIKDFGNIENIAVFSPIWNRQKYSFVFHEVMMEKNEIEMKESNFNVLVNEF